MPTYYRFEQEKPLNGEKLQCSKTLQGLKSFIAESKLQETAPNFSNMKFWKVEGTFINEGVSEIMVRINSSMQIKTSL